MKGLWNQQWLNANSQRRYPIAYDATVTDTTGSFVIPDDFVVEIFIAVDAALTNPAQFFIQSIGAFATGYSIVIAYQSNSGPVKVCSAQIARAAVTPNQVFGMTGIGQFSNVKAHIVIGSLDNIDQQPPGFWSFALADTRLDPDAIRPVISGVKSLVVVNGSVFSSELTGIVELEAGTNIVLVPIVVAGIDPIIQINAIDGAGLTEDCACKGDTDIPIKTINGIPPTPAGDFALLGDSCVGVESITNGLRLVDNCSKPCCGCQELQAITRDLEQFGQEATSLQSYVTRLGAVVDQMSLTVLGSRISDNSCDSCGT